MTGGSHKWVTLFYAPIVVVLVLSCLFGLIPATAYGQPFTDNPSPYRSFADNGSVTVVFNPTGTQFHNGYLKVRLDFFFPEGSQTYSQQYVDVLDPKTRLPTGAKQLNPALGVFVAVPPDVTKDQLMAWLTRIYDPDVLATLDNALIQPNSLHLVSPYLRDKTVLATSKVEATSQIIAEVNARLEGVLLAGTAVGTIQSISPQSIDIGPGATDRGTTVSTRTAVDKANPANDTGTIDTWEIWANSNLANAEVATFFVVSVNNLSTRDNEAIGAVASGSKQTFAGLSTNVTTGDYAGMYWSSGNMEGDSTGGAGIWSFSGDVIPCTNQAFSSVANYAISIYGTGTVPGGAPAAPTNVAATDGTSTGNVTITWTKSSGATGYTIWRDSTNVTAVGDVATYDDTGADAPTITAGTGAASDGTYTANVSLTITGQAGNNGITHSYKVQAHNDYGASDNSTADNGYRGVGALGYQWQVSAADSDADYSNIDGATSANYTYTGAPPPTIASGNATASDNTSELHVSLSISNNSTSVGEGRYYKLLLTASGASQNETAADSGYIGIGEATVQWYRSAADSDADYSAIDGATTASYDDTGAPSNGDGRYYKALFQAAGASDNYTTPDRGYRTAAAIVAPTVTTQATSSVEETTATLNGTVTATGGENVSRGFFWGTATGVYSDNYSDNSSSGTGLFSLNLSALIPGEAYYFIATANNTAGSGNGTELKFLTKPYEPTNGAATGGIQQITLEWTKPASANNSYVYAKQGSYPSALGDGDLLYSGADNTTSHAGLGDNETWFYRVWSYVDEDGMAQYSDAYTQMSATTDIQAPVVTTGTGASSITNTTARLNGEITDAGGENPTVVVFWGTSDGSDNAAAWTNNSTLGAKALGTFYYDSSNLTAGTTYYYTFRAVNTGGTDWPLSSATFSTANVTTISPPTNLTLTDLGGITVTANWTMGANSTYTMLRVARAGYPSTTSAYELVYYGPGTSTNLTGYPLDSTTFYVSAWGFDADNTTYSNTYATALIGGDGMTELTTALTTLGTNFLQIMVFVFIIFLAFWRQQDRDGIFLLFLGVLIAETLGFYWASTATAIGDAIWVQGVVIAVLGGFLLYKAGMQLIR